MHPYVIVVLVAGLLFGQTSQAPQTSTQGQGAMAHHPESPEQHLQMLRKLTFRWLPRPMRQEESWVMDAKYNYIIDSMKWRITLNLAGFGLWLAASVVLLRLS